MISPIGSLPPLIFNETSYRLKDVRFANQVKKLMPVNERVMIIIYGFEVEGREVVTSYKTEIFSFFIFWFFGGMQANFGEQAAKQASKNLNFIFG
jgi:hypothetical protein